MSWKADICIYHFPCDDGFASAWIARKRWPDIGLVPTNYGLPLPDVDICGKNILIADFSYKPDVLRDMSERALSIIILDHHKTAEEDLSGVSRLVGDASRVHLSLTDEPGLRGRCRAKFDMDHSGAALTWRFCFPNEEMPRLIKHIEDRDLWRMSLPDTRKISLLLRSYPYDFRIWDGLCLDDTHSIANMLADACSIERFYDQKLAEMLPTATLKSIGKWSGVPVAHAPYAFASDLAHELLKAHPDAPFAAVVVDAYGGRTYSLRSDDTRQDVSEVARSFGGGGHRNAAGFRVPV